MNEEVSKDMPWTGHLVDTKLPLIKRLQRRHESLQKELDAINGAIEIYDSNPELIKKFAEALDL